MASNSGLKQQDLGLNWSAWRTHKEVLLDGSRQGSLSQAGHDHDTTRDAVCVVQHLDGKEATYAQGRGMSASANHRQRAAVRVKRLYKPAKSDAAGADVSYIETYPSTVDSQTQFWT